MIADLGWERCAQQLAEGAWRWLGQVHPTFVLDFEATADTIDLIRCVKPLAELALAGMIGLREGPTGRHSTAVARRLIEFAWEQLRAGELLYELAREFPLDVLAGDTYAIFVRAGYHHDELARFLEHVHGLRASSVPEIVPNRALGVLNHDRVLGFSPRWDSAELTARTVLGVCPEPWTLDLGSLYSVTHIVYHLTDWGAHPGGLAQRLQDYLHDWLPVWTEVYLEAGQWDLVAELLMVDLCLSRPDFPASAWARLLAAQHDNGMLPAEAGRDTRTKKNLARNHYHSSVVAAIAGTLGVARRLDPTRQ